MHGIIHSAIKEFVTVGHGSDAWKAVLAEAGLSGKSYLTAGAYPDEEALAIVAAASKLTGAPAEVILESFGEFLVPKLLSLYGALVRPEWKTIEMLLQTEETIHRVLRIKNPGAEPPQLKFEQTSPDTLTLNYDSPRQMSAVAKGIIKGVASHYGETVTIGERPGPTGNTLMTIRVA